MQKKTNKHLGALAILHEDKHLLVVDKPPGLLTMGTESEGTRTAYYKLTDYVRRGNPKSRNRIFIVHRLDRETSGVLVFAKSQEVKEHLQAHWETTRKTYLAVVHGTPDPPVGTITSYLAENVAHQVFTTRNPDAGKLAKTNFKLLSSAKGYSLLEVDLLTGRKHQIRVHLADAGHPVVGDKKYGKKGEKAARLALHAWALEFQHPVTRQWLRFETQVPPFFRHTAPAEAPPRGE